MSSTSESTARSPEEAKAQMMQARLETMCHVVNAKDKIKVNKFKLGGSINKRGKAKIPANGVLENIRVGATAHVNKGDLIGEYQGSATMQVIYL